MRIDDFIDATNAAETADQVFSLYVKAISDFGYDRTLYAALRNHPSCSPAIPAVMRNYPDDWMAHYIEAGYIETDPVRHYCVVSRQPFLWSDIAKRVPRMRSRIFDEARSAGIRDGIGVPVHGPNGEAMGIGMASSIGNTDARFQLGKLHLIALQFHTVYSALVLPQDDGAEIRLTPREQEILQWCTQGKSNWAVGEVLGISEHAVDFHLRNTFRKLKVSTRTTAVVKALHLGLITL